MLFRSTRFLTAPTRTPGLTALALPARSTGFADLASPRRLAGLALLALLLLPAASPAYWDPSPAANVAVSLASGTKEDQFIVSDGAGGAIVVWEDRRSGDYDIYAQRIDVHGNALWQADGVAVCVAPGDQHLYRSSTGTTGFTPVIADGEGGVFIAWQDARFFSTRMNDIYCQRLDADGLARFAANGIAIAQGTGNEDQPTLCSDGAGGAFIVWQDKNEDPVFYDIWGQRIDGEGNRLWNNGLPRPLVRIGWDQDGPAICPDGGGGAFLAWTDSRDNLNDIYAQRLDAEGNGLWAENGIPVYSNGEGDAIVIGLAEDGNAILAWVDRRSGSPDIYGQKLAAANGAKLWGAAGRAVCNAIRSQYRPAMVTDGEAGAVFTWFDYRDAPSGPPWNLDIYAQRILSDGTPAWTPNGVPVCTAPDAQRDADAWSDGRGGIFIAWEDNRNGTGREDIYAQRLNGEGTALLEPNGRLVCDVQNNQERPDVVAGAGGMILSWKDDRDILYAYDVYADRVLTAAGAVIGVNRVGFDFGEVGYEAERTLRIGNVGVAPMTLLGIGFADGGEGFSAFVPVMLPAVLEPGESVEATITFDPWGGPYSPEHTDDFLIEHDAPECASSPEITSPVRVFLRGRTEVCDVRSGQPRPSRLSDLSLLSRPNPFASRVAIKLRLLSAASVAAEVLDVRGRLVRSLDCGFLPAGSHEISWDGCGHGGSRVAAGSYFVRVTAGESRESLRVVLAE